MFGRLKVQFAHDYDSDLYMLSVEPDARDWKVIVHCEGGKTYTPALEKFTPYPGTDSHEGEAAWGVDYYKPEQIEVLRPGRAPILLDHPDKPKK